MDESLETTLESAARGDESAWRVVIERYGRRVFGLLRSQCGDAELAEEIAQSVFCTVALRLRKGGGYVERGRFEAWLFRIAVNRLRDEMRRRKRRATTGGQGVGGPDLEPRADGRAGSPVGVLEKREQIAALRAALERLPDNDREILEFRHVAMLTFRQIAELLEEPLGTVLARHHRALGKLREMLS